MEDNLTRYVQSVQKSILHIYAKILKRLIPQHYYKGCYYKGCYYKGLLLQRLLLQRLLLEDDIINMADNPTNTARQPYQHHLTTTLPTPPNNNPTNNPTNTARQPCQYSTYIYGKREMSEKTRNE